MPETNAHGQLVGEPVSWAPARPPEPVVLTGRHVALRPLITADAPAVSAVLGQHVDLWTYQGSEAPARPVDAVTIIESAPASPEGTALAIVAPQDDALLGRVHLMRADPAMGVIEVGAIVYSPALQRTRAATEVHYLLAAHVFGTLGYRRYEWKCDSLNAPSRRAALRLGFTEEGTWRQALVVKGRNRDTTWFSMTDREWPRRGKALRRWLDDDNHDQRGVQRRSLVEVRTALAGSAAEHGRTSRELGPV